jgi:hypothetical protein
MSASMLSRQRCWRGLGSLAAVLAELKRAIAAEHRYETLRRFGGGAAPDDDIGRAGIARRIFDEFYSGAGIATAAPSGPALVPPRMPGPGIACEAGHASCNRHEPTREGRKWKTHAKGR